jgi:hypothetical protein
MMHKLRAPMLLRDEALDYARSEDVAHVFGADVGVPTEKVRASCDEQVLAHS